MRSRQEPESRCEVRWAAEACDHRHDPASSALITYLTCSALTSINIYCEQPYTSADGNRVAILRRRDMSFDRNWSLLVADLTTLKLGMVEQDCVRGIGNAAWSGMILYSTDEGLVRRLNLLSLETEELSLPSGGMHFVDMSVSVSPDQRYLAIGRVTGTPPTGQIVVIDLETQTECVILEHPELVNSHLQFNPRHGRDILIQHNRGSKLAADGTVESLAGAEGTTHFIISRDGSNRRDLACGPPFTLSSTGHSNFVADTGRIAWTTHVSTSDSSLDPRYPEGNLFTVGPDDSTPTVFAAPEHRFIHVNVSRCGRYFVSDSRPPSMYSDAGVLHSASLVIGNLESGKYATLVSDIGGPSGGGKHTHAHAYLTADNGNVIYNAPTLYGATQVCAARVPDGFLETLE
jgi:hypothetical protein